MAGREAAGQSGRDRRDEHQGRPGRRQLARRTLRKAFSVTDPGAVAGRRILLMDDVCASGYTLLTVARASARPGPRRWRPSCWLAPGGTLDVEAEPTRVSAIG